jgi:hypothetical protein
MILHNFLHNLLNILVEIANTMGLKKRPNFGAVPYKWPEYPPLFTKLFLGDVSR